MQPITQILASVTLLLATAQAALCSSLSTSSSFRLVANVTRFDLTPSIQGLQVGYLSTDDCLANLTLTNSGSSTVFLYNGEDVSIGQFPTSSGSNTTAGIIVSPGGTATVPSTDTVQVQCSNSTNGVQISPDTMTGEPYLDYQLGTWTACPSSVINLDGQDNSTVYLSYKKAGQRTLLGCAEVELLPTCDRASEASEGGIAVACFEDL